MFFFYYILFLQLKVLDLKNKGYVQPLYPLFFYFSPLNQFPVDKMHSEIHHKSKTS